jgi:biopolymer transport protein ExbB/TolQ
MLQDKMFAFALLGAEWVMWLLVLLSIVCITVAAERFYYQIKNQTPLSQLQKVLTDFFQTNDLQSCKASLQGLSGIEAKTLLAGVEAYERGGIHSAEQAIAGVLIFEKSKLDKGLIVIGTTGANAPFIGLFGTVLGIIKAFDDLASNSAEGAESVMAGISEALVATAIGLLVAIPAVVLFNSLKKRNSRQVSRLESMGHLLLSHLENDATSTNTKSTEGT